MVDLQRVCAMCGDVGFPDKLFLCSICNRRLQHEYCSNYYSEQSHPIKVCNWCQSEQRSWNNHGGTGGPSRRSTVVRSESAAAIYRTEYSGEKTIKQVTQKTGRNNGGAPSPRTRRYKLLKDVMC